MEIPCPTTHHGDNLRVYTLCDDSSLSGYIVEHFVKGLRFDLFPAKLRARIIKVEYNRALMQFSDKKLWSIVDSDL